MHAYIYLNDPALGLTLNQQNSLESMLDRDYIENTPEQIHNAVYIPILSLTILVIGFISFWICYNSWLYGYKQNRFKQSYLLAGFYCAAIFNMLILFIQTLSTIAHLVYSKNQFD